jgi:acetamidase/formamidase
MPTHFISCEKFHTKWNNKLIPISRVNPGESVQIEVMDASAGQITETTTNNDLARMKPILPLTGPIFVNGANPGNTLVVKILEMETAHWGHTEISPGHGFLPKDFGNRQLAIWRIESDRFLHCDSIPNVRVPVRPFCGAMGVAPRISGEIPTMPPGCHGGNLDIKYLTVGSTLYLPIFNQGALFSIGDAHLAQGDGEVCVTAVETSGLVTLEFGIKNGQILEEPYFETETHFATTAFATTIDVACRKALKYLIQYLVSEKNLLKDSAYMLASVAADLKVFEVVDSPHVLAGAMIPKSLFYRRDKSRTNISSK